MSGVFPSLSPTGTISVPGEDTGGQGVSENGKARKGKGSALSSGHSFLSLFYLLMKGEAVTPRTALQNPLSFPFRTGSSSVGEKSPFAAENCPVGNRQGKNCGNGGVKGGLTGLATVKPEIKGEVTEPRKKGGG